jgi:tRNA A37 threonylcarbamoyladenosine biosynthesis protein TsaE
MDAYRLDSALEAEQLDLDSMLADGALLIEWPERIDGLVPHEHLWIDLSHKSEEEREMKFKAVGKRYEELLEIVRGAEEAGE